MENKKICMVTRLDTCISLSGDFVPRLIDIHLEEGSILSYDYAHHEALVNIKLLKKNRFLGKINTGLINFYCYDAQVELKENNLNLPDGQFVFFSLDWDKLKFKRAYATNIEVINAEYQFIGKVHFRFIDVDDYELMIELRDEDVDIFYSSVGQVVSFNIAWEGDRAYAANVKKI